MKNLNPIHHTNLMRLLLYFTVMGIGLLIPTIHANAQASSTINIHVWGNTGAEAMTLTVNGQTLHSSGNIQSGSDYKVYPVTVTNQMTINSIRVNSTSGEGWPHALIVDKIVIDGISYQSEAGTTRSYGSWNENTACAEGYKNSEWLSCPNAWFEYEAAQGVVLAEGVDSDTPLIIFDTDMGPDIDDALALAMLHAYESNGDAEIAAVTVSRNSDLGARYCDLVNTFYNRPDIPVGKYFGTTSHDSNDSRFSGPLAQSGTYPHDVHTNGSIKEGYKLMREVLAGAADNSVIIVQTGFFVNTAALLASPPDNISPLTGAQLVAQKVAFISIMGGRNNSPAPEFNAKIDAQSTQYVFANSPVDIIQSEFNLGYNILYPLASIQNDFNYVTNHPIKDAYLNTDIDWHHNNGNYYDMRTWDLTSVIAAIDPISEYFNLGQRGNVAVENNGRTIFTPNSNGKVRSLGYSWDYTSAEQQKMIDRMIELTSQPPTNTGNLNTITIHARGNTGAENMTLTVNGQILDTWNNIQSGNNYLPYKVNSPMTINSIRVNSSSGQGWPHALIIDKIVINGTSYESEAASTLSYGSWTESTSCAEGYKQSEWLSCPNGWFEYNVNAPDQDGDGIPDVSDNCPSDSNPNQADNDSDGQGNICDPSPNGDNNAQLIDASEFTVYLDPTDPESYGPERDDCQLIVAGNRFNAGEYTDNIQAGSGYGLSFDNNLEIHSFTMEDGDSFRFGTKNVSGLQINHEAICHKYQFKNDGTYDESQEVNGINFSTSYPGIDRLYYDGTRAQYACLSNGQNDPLAVRVGPDCDRIQMVTSFKIEQWMFAADIQSIIHSLHEPGVGIPSPVSTIAGDYGKIIFSTREKDTPVTSSDRSYTLVDRAILNLSQEDIGKWWSVAYSYCVDPVGNDGYLNIWLDKGSGFEKIVSVNEPWGYWFGNGNINNELFYPILCTFYSWHRYTNDPSNAPNNWDDAYGNVREMCYAYSGLSINGSLSNQQLLNHASVFTEGNISPPANDCEQVQNGNFTGQFTNDWGVQNCQATHANGGININVPYVAQSPWHIGVKQRGFNYEQGKEYRISFKAKADAPRRIYVKAGKASADWDTYNYEPIDLTTTLETHSFPFIMNKPTDSNAFLEFFFGESDSNLFLGEVSLVETDCAGLRENLSNEIIDNYTVFPNPVNDILNIQFDLMEAYNSGTIRLFDVNGKTILEQQEVMFSTNQFQLNIQAIPAGVYMLRVDVGGYFLTHKVVKY